VTFPDIAACETLTAGNGASRKYREPSPSTEEPLVKKTNEEESSPENAAPLQYLATAKPGKTEVVVKHLEPAPAVVAPVITEDLAKTAMPFTMKRRQRLDDEELCKQLLLVPEVDLDKVPMTSLKMRVWGKHAETDNRHFSGPALLRDQRSDLAGLPFRMGVDCHVSKESAENLQVLSRKLRGHLQASLPADGIDCRLDAERLRQHLLGTQDDSRNPWLQAQAVPTLVQMLQPENQPVRQLLVDLLARNPDPSATRALTMRALFDVSAPVREAAVRALRDRAAQDARPLLLDGLRYPWPAVADNAAETLVALGDREAIPMLRDLLDEPSPTAPVHVAGRPSMVREMVRINHLGNCLLCHAPSFARTDLVRGAVPARGQPLPAAPTSAEYYDRGGVFVRADVTYLKQDFSVMQPLANPGPWPRHQRYDYVIRLRRATKLELAIASKSPSASYSQRDAVLFALRELTGDRGDTVPSLPATDFALRPIPAAARGAEANGPFGVAK